MPLLKDELQASASHMFSDALSAEIQAKIERDATEAAPAARTRGGITPESAATLFLGDRLYKKLGQGKFSGRLALVWNGMDSFIFVPDPSFPFTYTTSGGRVIKPRVMETDGGSIPRILRGLKKFSSWGYAPAFIIHDWLFVAKKCQAAPDNDWEFAETAGVMAEAMKTLMEAGYQSYRGETFKLEKAEDTLYLMYQAVSSSIAQNLWDDDTSVQCLT